MMRVRVGEASLELVQGDITLETTDAIVNAANEALRPGGGVDGAITRAAGSAALAARFQLGPCPTGEAKIGPGGALAARFIIYAVGPIYQGGQADEARLLSSAYRRSLELCREHRLQSVAFPAISTGIYGYPMDEAAQQALTTIIDCLQTADFPRLVRIVLFDTPAFEIWVNVLKRMDDTRR